MRHLRRLVVLCSLTFPLVIPGSAVAASPWTALGPFGGSASVAVDPDDARVVYASTEWEGVFRSADAGANWARVIRGSVTRMSQLAVAPGGIVYVFVEPGKVAKSTDHGLHWAVTNVNLPDPVGALAVDPAQPSRVYAASLQGGIWRSVDGGTSWQPANVGFGLPLPWVNQIAVLSKPAGTVYLATGFGLYKSPNGGSSWRALRGGLPRDFVQSLAVSPTDPRTVYAGSFWDRVVYRSTDGGATWTKTDGDFFAYSLAVSPRSPRLVFAGTGTGLQRSTDGGEHWTAVGPGSLYVVNAVAVAPSALRFVYAGLRAHGVDEPGGVLVSEDGGLTWSRRNRGLAALETLRLTPNPGVPGNLLTVVYDFGQYRIFSSRNGGAPWRRLPLPDPVKHSAYGVAVPPLEPSTTYILSPGGVWRTVDGGGSWTKMRYPGDGGASSQFLRADPLDPDGLWSDRQKILYRSPDGGATWTQVQGLDAIYYIADLAFAPSSPGTVYVAGVSTEERATVYRSEDGGATWTRADQGLDAPFAIGIAVDPVDPRRVYAAGSSYFTNGGGVWVSGDGGATWSLAGEELRGVPVRAVAASLRAGVVWAVTLDHRMFRSGDGGASWQEQADFPASYVRQLMFDPFDPRKLYAATSGGLYMTVDEP